MVHRIVSKFAFAIVAILVAGGCIIVLYLVVAPKAQGAESGYHWKGQEHPYATTRADAIQKREDAFRAVFLPTPVFTQLLRVTEKPGEKVWLTAGDHFEALILKGIVHHDVVVALENVPISAEKWEVYWEGKIFSAFLVFPQKDKVYWGIKIRTTAAGHTMACSPFGAGHISLSA